MCGVRHVFVDFGAREIKPGDDYPDSVRPLARSVAAGMVGRGVAFAEAAPRPRSVRIRFRAGGPRARLRGLPRLEYDDMNILRMLRMGGRGPLAAFFAASFTGEERQTRRLGKVAPLDAAQRAAEEIPVGTGPIGS